ncbi:hypothetical protein [Flavobacterium sp. UBA6031]|uniref:hypothetical protein n=1 Tax=Flavobacterium sp. UBA6031 TaxID=1946551 RepID=UPI0025BD01B5|nr:hypothetical protein [Flavobacterium sp. UBA6031]
MIKEVFYFDGRCSKIVAASIGIGLKQLEYIKSSNIGIEDHENRMKTNRFDVLPIVSDDGSIVEFYKTNVTNNYEFISRTTIIDEDKMPFDTSIREVIKEFVIRDRIFYFLTYQDRISGLISISNLNCRQVQVYIFELICELERSLNNFIEKELSENELEMYIEEESKTNNKLKKAWTKYQRLVKEDLENKLLEHLYFIDFFFIIEHFEFYNLLGYQKNEWEELKDLNNIRTQIAHSTKNLIDKRNDIKSLWKRIRKIEELIFKLRTYKNNKNTI